MVRRIVLAFVAIWLTVVVAYSVVPTASSVPLEVPTGHAGETISIRCGPLWGASYVHPTSTPYPMDGNPCSFREQDRIMTIFDVVLGAGVLGFLLTWRRLGFLVIWRRIRRRMPVAT